MKGNATLLDYELEDLLSLADSFEDSEFRSGFVDRFTRSYIADQMRALRGDLSQGEFGKVIDKPQSVISRLEDEEYGRVNIQTLIDIASKLDIALKVSFAEHEDFFSETVEMPFVTPRPYDRHRWRQFREKIAERASPPPTPPTASDGPALRPDASPRSDANYVDAGKWALARTGT